MMCESARMMCDFARCAHIEYVEVGGQNDFDHLLQQMQNAYLSRCSELFLH